ncbi:MAG: HD-GYP domain-containing protein [Actinobacteria bacterium]|nr:MAG: HD-GYP domain-containing protein [Actinomycetota bacterium]
MKKTITKEQKDIIFSSFLIIPAFLLLLVLFSQKMGSLNLINVIVFAALAVTCEFMAIKMPKIGVVSVGQIVFLTSIILFGPLTATLVAGLASARWERLPKIDPWHYYISSISESIISVSIASIAYYKLPWSVILSESGGFTSNNFPFIFFPLFVCAAIYYLLNTSIFSITIGIAEGISVINFWVSNCIWIMPNHFALTPLALVFAEVYSLAQPYGYAAVALFVIPLLISRYTYKVFTDLQKAYTDTISSLIKAVEAKDAYTKGHSERVAKYSELLAKKIGLKDDELEALKRIALLHDIGKIGIPKRILTKADKLDDHEYDLIKEHPKIGAQILKDVEFLQDVISSVYYHHERIDGKGYASGLAGNAIPLFARIIAIADSYDAMSSDRAYRDALSPEEIIAEFKAGSGTQFDQELVEYFFEVIEAPKAKEVAKPSNLELSLDNV